MLTGCLVRTQTAHVRLPRVPPFSSWTSCHPVILSSSRPKSGRQDDRIQTGCLVRTHKAHNGPPRVKPSSSSLSCHPVILSSPRPLLAPILSGDGAGHWEDRLVRSGLNQMPTWPHQPTPLSQSEKRAYRSLLHWGMLDIRMLCQNRGPESRNPILWRRQYRKSRVAGALADWLHHLAQSAAADFVDFDPDWFWREYDTLCARHKQVGPGRPLDYRHKYEHQFVERG